MAKIKEFPFKIHPSLEDLEYWKWLAEPTKFVGLYGLSSLPLIAMRREPSDAAEMVGQLCFGDLFQVMDIGPRYLLVQRLFRDHQISRSSSMAGWIDNHLVPAMIIPEVEFYRLKTKAKFGYVASPLVIASSDDWQAPPLPLPAGSRLPDFRVERTHEEGQFVCSFKIAGSRYLIDDPSTTIFEGTAAPTLDNLCTVLKAFLGTPYLWGGQTSWGVDCSGLTQSVFRIFGLELPRDACVQSNCGRRISFKEADNGALAFYQRRGGANRQAHVGIILRHPAGLSLYHAKQRVKCQLLKQRGHNSENMLYPESTHEVACGPVMEVIRFKASPDIS